MSTGLPGAGEPGPPDRSAPSPPEQGNGSSLDADALNRIRCLGIPGMLREVIEIYLTDAPAVLESLRHAIQAEDANALRQNAHRFKSSSANLGAIKVAALCRMLEQTGQAGSLENAEALIFDLETEYAVARQALLATADGETD